MGFAGSVRGSRSSPRRRTAPPRRWWIEVLSVAESLEFDAHAVDLSADFRYPSAERVR